METRHREKDFSAEGICFAVFRATWQSPAGRADAFYEELCRLTEAWMEKSVVPRCAAAYAENPDPQKRFRLRPVEVLLCCSPVWEGKPVCVRRQLTVRHAGKILAAHSAEDCFTQDGCLCRSRRRARPTLIARLRGIFKKCLKKARRQKLASADGGNL